MSGFKSSRQEIAIRVDTYLNVFRNVVNHIRTNFNSLTTFHYVLYPLRTIMFYWSGTPAKRFKWLTHV
jgi:hypothetical protein